MAVVGFFHHIGTFLLFVAMVLLIITDITAPVVHKLAILKIDLGNSTGGHHTSVMLGTFGNCIVDTAAGGADFCSSSQVGYNPAEIMSQTDGTQFSQYATDTTKALTKALILVPIATGITFIAFMLTLGAGVVGSFLASLVALLAFIVTLAVLIIAFVLFSIVRSNVNDDGTGAQANYSTGMWTLLVAAICTLLGTVIVFFSCCSARLHRQRRSTTKDDVGYAAAPRRRRRWF